MLYYQEVKWCDKCKKYVHYLVGLDSSHCVVCDSKVVVFSPRDMRRFHQTPVMPEV